MIDPRSVEIGRSVIVKRSPDKKTTATETDKKK
jgi:hypothetical protein